MDPMERTPRESTNKARCHKRIAQSLFKMENTVEPRKQVSMRLSLKVMQTMCVMLLTLLFAACASPKKDKTVEGNIKMYSYAWDVVINEGKIDVLDSAFSPDIVVHASPNDIRGITDAKKFYANYITGFSNREFIVKDIFGQGDKLVKHWAFKGTHTGDFFGIPATGKAVNVEGATIARIVNGKIVEERDFFDNLEFSQQLGIIPR